MIFILFSLIIIVIRIFFYLFFDTIYIPGHQADSGPCNRGTYRCCELDIKYVLGQMKAWNFSYKMTFLDFSPGGSFGRTRVMTKKTDFRPGFCPSGSSCGQRSSQMPVILTKTLSFYLP